MRTTLIFFLLFAPVAGRADDLRITRALLTGTEADIKARCTGKTLRIAGKIHRPAPRDGMQLAVVGLAIKAVPKRAAMCVWKASENMGDDFSDGDVVEMSGPFLGVSIENGAIVALMNPCKVKVIKAAPLAVYDAAKLTRDYESNQVKAAKEYDEYQLEITGTVARVAPNGDGAFVELVGHKPGWRVYGMTADGVDVTGLAKGRRTRLRCTVGGYRQDSEGYRTVRGVSAEGCMVVK